MLGTPVGVEGFYQEILNDNYKVISKLGADEIQAFANLLKVSKNPDALKLLAVICECDDSPMVNNQTEVARCLLLHDRDLVYHTRVAQQGELQVSTNGAKSWTSLRAFASSGKSVKGGKSGVEYKFFQAQLDLYAKLCLGRNEETIELLTTKLQLMDVKQCLAGIEDKTLPRSLRVKYINLLIHLFLDVGNAVDRLSEIQLTFAWDKIGADADVVGTDDQSWCAKLTGRVIEFLAGSHALVCEEKSQNLLVEANLRLLHFLISFGYCRSPSRIERAAEAVIAIADGRHDVPNKVTPTWQGEARFERGETNNTVMDVKFQALRVLESLLNFIAGTHLEHFLRDFQRVRLLHAGFTLKTGSVCFGLLRANSKVNSWQGCDRGG